MKQSFTLALLFICMSSILLPAQSTFKPRPSGQHSSSPVNVAQLKPFASIPVSVPPAARNIISHSAYPYQSIPELNRPMPPASTLKVIASDNGLPIMIKGRPAPDQMRSGNSIPAQCFDYLGAIKDQIQIDQPAEEFAIQRQETDELGQTHVRLQQMYLGIPVYGAEVVLHAHNGNIDLFNGRYYPSSKLANLAPAISETAATQTVTQDVATKGPFHILNEWDQQLLGSPQFLSELVIYHPERNKNIEKLSWHITVFPTIAGRWEYFIDAQSGEIIHAFKNICNLNGAMEANASSTTNQPTPIEENAAAKNCVLDGPATANATDLAGVTRTINTYLSGGKYYLIDASRPMFNAGQSSFPNDPVGVIQTINAGNTSPQNNNFSVSDVTTTNNQWNNPKAVSAQYNGGIAYEYYRTTHNRNSINGQGGNIVGIINVADQDGSGMDNAFWNGQAMFYGNGNQAFTPLARGLDVAGHEMSHGVIQKTANLEYQTESGALNESYADVFGAMIDRDDWRIGEDVVTSYFPSGALRDMSNPHNGGNTFSDPGYQPAHVNEKYNGSADNGGVHINSGIPNKAFYLFANNGSVGKDKAEKVYYRALDKYLVMSSQFIDLRSSVIQSINDLGYGAAVVNAANSAFDAVGIGGGGNAGGTNYQQPLPVNPGQDYILVCEPIGNTINNMYIANTDGSNPVQIYSGEVLSRPSITDDGSLIVFTGGDKKLYYLTLDWGTGNVGGPFELSGDPSWRNVVVSKDGSKIAAVYDNLINIIYVYDFATQQGLEFGLSNPTTGNGDISTGEVQYADALEFDYSGEYVMYDAYNIINGSNGSSIDYWDIGFLRAWSNSSNSFGDGFINKLFSSIPENTSVGNPTFAKNSPFIVAFDYLDNNNSTYNILGANLETGDVGTILENASALAYPNYSKLDNKLIFNATSFSGDAINVINLATSKITSSGSESGLIDGGYWGVWFATGLRNLSATSDLHTDNDALKVYPNPFENDLQLEWTATSQEDATVRICDLLGKLIWTDQVTMHPGENQITLSPASLPAGSYLISVSSQNRIATKIAVKN